MVKILFVSHESCVMGSTLSMLSLIKGLREINPDLDIEIILPFSIQGKAKRLLKENHIKYKELLYRNDFLVVNNPRKVREHFYDILNFFSVGCLFAYMKIAHVSVVCSNSTAVDVGARAALSAGISHVYYIREFMEEDHGFSYRNKARMKKLFEMSANTIFISKAIEKKYSSLYHFKNVSQFFDGFIVQDYYIPKHSILDSEKISFVQVGRLSDGKGAQDTIQLLKKISENGITDWDMEFIGSGDSEYIAQMKSLIVECQLEQQVFMRGSSEHVKEKLANKDILIMNSEAEGFGRVTVEGMLAGCLVIGKRRGGTKEIIKNGENGCIFESEEQFTEIIHNILQNKEKFRKIAFVGQEYAINQFHYTNTAKKFMKVMEACL